MAHYFQQLFFHDSKVKKYILIILSFLCFLLLIFLCLLSILYINGKKQFEKRSSYIVPSSISESDRFYFQDPQITAAPFSETFSTELQYQGNTYLYNKHLIVLYMMGIDSDSKVSETASSEGGQSDANFLIFIDTAEKNIRLVSVNRNAMTSIDIYDAFDEYGYTIPGQLCLQHAYGDGMEESCERSCDALSRLLYHMPVNGYYALQKGSIAALNDAVGGVKVTALEDVIFPQPETIIKKGENVLLLGSNAYYYLTFRYVENFGSNNGRLERERQYINAFLDKFFTSCIHNPFIITNFWQILKDYSVTDLSTSELFYLFTLSRNYTIDTNIYNLPGKTTLDGAYESYTISDEDMTSFILHYFYQKKES